jgi:hypothetical protein
MTYLILGNGGEGNILLQDGTQTGPFGISMTHNKLIIRNLEEITGQRAGGKGLGVRHGRREGFLAD